MEDHCSKRQKLNHYKYQDDEVDDEKLDYGGYYTDDGPMLDKHILTTKPKDVDCIWAQSESELEPLDHSNPGRLTSEPMSTSCTEDLSDDDKLDYGGHYTDDGPMFNENTLTTEAKDGGFICTQSRSEPETLDHSNPGRSTSEPMSTSSTKELSSEPSTGYLPSFPTLHAFSPDFLPLPNALSYPEYSAASLNSSSPIIPKSSSEPMSTPGQVGSSSKSSTPSLLHASTPHALSLSPLSPTNIQTHPECSAVSPPQPSSFQVPKNQPLTLKTVRPEELEEKEQAHNPLENEQIPLTQLLIEEILDSSARRGYQTLYNIYQVSCRKGEEDRIFSQISSDINSVEGGGLLLDSIAAVYTSPLPGYIYLQSIDMSPANLNLAQYLYQVHGFLYPQRDHVLPLLTAPDESFIIQSADSISNNNSIRPFHPASDSGYLPVLTKHVPNMGHVGTTAPRNPLLFSRGHQIPMPIHRKLPPDEKLPYGIKTFTSMGFQISSKPWDFFTWVKVKEGKNHFYEGDLGFVMKPNGDQINHSKLTVIALIPRLGTVKVDGRVCRTPPKLFDVKEATQLSHQYKVPQPENIGHWNGFGTSCPYPNCVQGEKSTACVHLQVWKWNGMEFQSGLAIQIIPTELLEDAPSAVSYTILRPFVQSGHPDFMSQELLWDGMPMRTDWVFDKGDKVCVTSPGGSQYRGQLYQLHEESNGLVKGVVEDVGDHKIKVVFGEKRMSLSPWFLRKTFGLCDPVLSPRGESGMVLDMREFLPQSPTDSWIVTLFLGVGAEAWPANAIRYENSSRSQHQPSASHSITDPPRSANTLLPAQKSVALSIPRSEKAPWVKTEVLIYKKGHPLRARRADVYDVKEDNNTISGLSLHVRVQNMTGGNPFSWFDFNDLRLAETYYFIEGDPRGGPKLRQRPQYNYKPGYIPQLTPYELEAQEAATRMYTLTNAQVPKSILSQPPEEAVHSDTRFDKPPPDHEWLLDTRYKKALNKLEVFLNIYHGPFKGNDIPVLLISDGKGQLVPQIYTNPKRIEMQEVKMSDIYEKGKPKAKVFLDVARIRDAFLVIASSDPQQKKEHVGKVVRRVVDDKETGKELEDKAWGSGYFKAVEVRFVKGTRSSVNYGYVEEVVEPLNFFTVHRDSILKIHLTSSGHTAGNKNVLALRVKFEGYLEPNEKKSSQ